IFFRAAFTRNSFIRGGSASPLGNSGIETFAWGCFSKFFSDSLRDALQPRLLGFVFAGNAPIVPALAPTKYQQNPGLAGGRAGLRRFDPIRQLSSFVNNLDHAIHTTQSQHPAETGLRYPFSIERGDATHEQPLPDQ